MTACRRWEETRSTRRPILGDDILQLYLSHIFHIFSAHVKVINALLTTLEAPTVFSFLDNESHLVDEAQAGLKVYFVSCAPNPPMSFQPRLVTGCRRGQL